ncbi:ATP-dependent helicase HrpB [Fulvivirga sp. RKSG066]|uniref:ATP-dependent helicase HrpB n=1 Tax=Fulvivirga aurantia TaxID=2529383 RepID=UPI0012BC2D88|nr:ATP-dependent helicase HrpB [Fulvivirga aurantia]MTI21208.1 ATP-dependent helicase HrpB [Fulvivirga aurantia]
MTFDYSNIDLPVKEIIPEVKKSLQDHTSLIISAPPGVGKSTLLPLALFEEEWLNGKKILMLEPRRLAAKTIANRMASLLGENVGETVGYRIRFDNKVTSKTKIEVVTEGILTRMLHGDNELTDVGMIIFDEFHERSIHADVALALSRESQQVLRPDLRILIMSATLDMPMLSAKLDNAPIIESKGRQYPVDIIYTNNQDMMLLPEMTSRTVIRAAKEQKGDILVFLPGQGEIKKTEEILKKELSDFAIHPLYGQLPWNKQYAAIMPDKNGKRKVVLATSIAETSLTIEGITVVVDCGYGRASKFDPNSGLSRLETIQISKDSADQRAGRAGRLSAGTCYRMWSKATQLHLQDHRTPEIEEADLAPLALDLAQWGINDVNQLTWLSTPPAGHLFQAYDVLEELGALEDGSITDHGKEIHQLPCHPRIAHMLIKADLIDLLPLATDIAAVIEEKDPLAKDAGIDVNLRIEALRRYRSRNSSGGKFGRIEKVANQYRRMFDAEVDNNAYDVFEAGLLLAYAYPERIASSRPGNNAQFQLANGKYAMAGHRDDLAHEPWLAVAHIDARDGMGKIFMAAPLNPKDLAPMVVEKEIITWDTKKGGLIASKDLRIGSIVLRSTPLPQPDDSKLIKAICTAVKAEGKNLLNFDDSVTQWQNRVMSLKKWNTGDNWPDVSITTLLATCDKWLSPYLNNIKSPEDLKKIDLVNVLHHNLDYELQEKLDRLAPQKMEVPTGSQIKIEYKATGEPPILAVRLQEVFGLTETPTVNNGNTSVLMHLLSPGFKLVQITGDLKSFWSDAYFEVKKDLKRRYPKHEWPDDPLKAEPIRGVKKKQK